MVKQLDEYQRKRNFHRTREPRGGEVKEAGGFYVIQRHAARRLHFDLRLEMNGVLKSWAVPKGPSLDPGEKRLAMEVEDHPLEYGDFEGIIPKGHYGGGTVQIWDHGRWFPVGHANAGYGKGALKFMLEGVRLRGKWALVKIKEEGDGDRPSWLLIKEQDREALPGSGDSIVLREQTSVVSGRTMAEIADAASAVWTGLEQAESRYETDEGDLLEELPQFLEPQLATLVKQLPEGNQWVHEIKYDGYRLLCRIGQGKAHFFTRSGNDWTSRFPTLVNEMSRLGIDASWIDGEAVILREDGTTSFQDLQNALGEGWEEEIVYYVFDAMVLAGRDLRRLSLERRKELLALRVGTGSEHIHFASHWSGEGSDFLQAACERGAEGIISKQRDAPYSSGRSKSWLKLKCISREEFIIIGYTDRSNRTGGFGSLLLGTHDESGRLIYAGKVGTGFDERAITRISKQLEDLKTETSEIEQEPVSHAGRSIHWVQPKLVAEVAYTEKTSEGKLRHPSFQGLREDKAADEVMLERPAELNTMVASVSPQPQPEVEGYHIHFTNPERVLYAEHAISKLDLARYYLEVADRILPYLERRPLTLVRCPRDYRDCFFQKHATQAVSKHIQRVPILEEGKRQDYMAINSPDGLLSLVQMGVLEIHTWNSRSDFLELPDRLVFDLDPDEGLPWEATAEGALLVRDRLLNLELENFIKTSGGKGFHIVVPIQPEHAWDAVRDFCQKFAEGLARDYPQKFTPKMAKDRRMGRMFLDWMRNIRGATVVEVYSTRARPGAPVSIPIEWEELATGTLPGEYTLEAARKRMEKLVVDPWRNYFRIKQRLSPL